LVYHLAMPHGSSSGATAALTAFNNNSEVYLHKHVARFFVKLDRLRIRALLMRLTGLRSDVCCLYSRGRKGRENTNLTPR